MADPDFVIPTKPEDLLSSEDPVEDIELSTALHDFDGVVDRLCDQSTSITNHENLDVLFSLIRNYSELNDSIKFRVFDVLVSGLSCLAVHIERILSEACEDSESAFDRKIARNALKVHLFLLKWFMASADKDTAEAPADAKVSKSKSSKAGAKAAPKRGGRIIEAWNWEVQRSKLINTLSNTVQVDLVLLWSPCQPEEAAVGLFLQSAFAAMANASAAKDKDLRCAAIRTTVRTVKSFGQRVNAVTAVMSLLHQHEHSSGPMAELIATAWEAQESALVSDVLREIGRIPMAELSRDTGAARNIAAFLTDLAELAPAVILMNMSVLNPHLQQGESYMMRNAIIHAIGFTLVELVSIIRKERSDTAIKTRESLLQILRERAHDVNAFTRSKVLQVWAFLCDKDAIPTKAQPAVVQLATARLEDKSGQVRKSAIQLLKLMIQKNPYGPSLPLSVFREKLTGAQAAMATADEAAVAAINSLAPKVEDVASDESTENQGKAPPEDEDETDNTGAAPLQTASEKELDDLKTRVNFYQSAVQFITTVHKAVGFIESLLRSKTTSDVVEAIDFLMAAYPFQMEVAQQSVRRMLLLVWSKETGIRDGVIDAYRAIFLNPLAQDSSRQAMQVAAQRLAGLVEGASVGELTSLERVMCELSTGGHIPAGLINLLWDMFASHESPSAGILLSLSASAMPKLLWPRLRTLLQSPAAAAFKSHPVQARTICVMCQRLADGGALSARDERDLIARFVCDVVAREAGADDDRWLLAVEQAINALFRVDAEPHVPCARLIRALTVQAFVREAAPDEQGGATLCESWRLARLLFVVGHAAVKQLAYLEGVAAAQARAQDQAGEGAGKKPTGKAGAKEGEEDDLAAQVGTADAAVQETRAELAREMGERELLSSAGLVGLFGPLLRQICLDTGSKYSDTRVRSCAILSLCKLMCVSSPYCEENLQLLFSIMMGAPEPSVRSNIVVALGDMAFRWTNLTEPWMAHIYALLRDDDGQVRTNTLTVLTHLVLNDMVKVRGQISELALCLEDTDERIQDMARLFFSEFRHKQQGMLLYNLLPDMISRLSAGDVEEGKFRRVVRFVFSFVDKARQTDGLVDKLCQRFRATDVPRQWRDVAFCLAQLSYSEKSVRRLLEEANFRAFADKLHDEDIAASLAAVVAKAKKLPKGADGKSIADELEARLLAAHENLVVPQDAGEDGEAAAGNQAAAAPPASRSKAGKGKGKQAAKKGPAKGRTRRAAASSDEEDADGDSGPESPRSAKPAPSRAARPAARSAAARSRKVKDESEEDEDEEESAGEEEEEAAASGDKENARSNAPAKARAGKGKGSAAAAAPKRPAAGARRAKA